MQPPAGRKTCLTPRVPLFGILLISFLLFAVPAALARDAGNASAEAVVQPATVADASEVGLVERLGEKARLDLTFTDEQGVPVTLRSLVDGPTVLVPIYFRCPNVCNFLQTSLAAALQDSKRLPGDGYRILSVSFDERETTEHAQRAKKAYLNAVGKPISEDGWRFLTGDPESIRQFTDSLGFGFKRENNDFLHPVTMAVISEDGTIVRYLHGINVLTMDLNLAVMEASTGQVSTPIRKMLTYCFSYDPEGRRYVFNILRVSATGILLAAGSLLLYLLLSSRRKSKH